MPGETRAPTPEDHVAIVNLLARYCLCLDVDDIDAWVALFVPDATYEVFGRSWEGEEGLRKMTARAPKGLHMGGPPVIEMVSPNEARTTQNMLFLETGSPVLRPGVYTDELRRTEDGWRIAKRRCRFITPDGLSDRPAE